MLSHDRGCAQLVRSCYSRVTMARRLLDLASVVSWPEGTSVDWRALASLIVGAVFAVGTLAVLQVACRHFCLQYLGPCTGISIEEPLLKGKAGV